MVSEDGETPSRAHAGPSTRDAASSYDRPFGQTLTTRVDMILSANVCRFLSHSGHK
jgi:hypothetical protein